MRRALRNPSKSRFQPVSPPSASSGRGSRSGARSRAAAPTPSPAAPSPSSAMSASNTPHGKGDLLDVVIVGAGPAGLAAAIAAHARGLRYAVLEKGALVNSLQHYPTDMVFFTTPE